MLISATHPDPEDVWGHLRTTVLPRYIRNSLWLALGSVGLTLVTGTSTAWLVTRYRFPGSRIFQWALLLPMAMPAYVMAYCWTDLLEYAGPVQSALREQFNWTRRDYWFPEIRSLPGAIFMFGFALYPYVYLSARSSFLEQGSSIFESSRSLGWGPVRTFLRLGIPMARPGIAAGCALVAMESLADYGTVDYFGVQTFTTGIYRTWTGFGSYTASVRLALLLLAAVAIVLFAERVTRGGQKFHRLGHRTQRTQHIRLCGASALVASLMCFTPLLFGFFIPAIRLAHHAFDQTSSQDWLQHLPAAATSLRLGLLAGTITCVLAVIICYGKRLQPTWLRRVTSRTASFGYAVPGSVFAVAIIVPLAWSDNHILDPVFGSKLLLSGTSFAMLYAYCARFLAVCIGSVDSGLEPIPKSVDQSARSLGASPCLSLFRIHLPLLRTALATGFMLVFVDVLKELPATMLLRPVGIDTLAVHVHSQVSQESLHLAALPSLLIVLTGCIPTLILTRRIVSDSWK